MGSRMYNILTFNERRFFYWKLRLKITSLINRNQIKNHEIKGTKNVLFKNIDINIKYF